jgi:small GTP-binding protein
MDRGPFKVLIIGGGGAGKMDFLMCYFKTVCPHATPRHLAVDFLPITVLVNGRHVALQVWELPEQREFDAMSPAWTRGADGALIFYKITDRDSFDEASEMLQDFQRHMGASIPIVVVGTTCDMEDARQVYMEEGATLARLHGVCFVEASAKEDVNVTRAFDLLVASMLERPTVEPQRAVPRPGSMAAEKRSPLASVRAMFARR